MKYKREFKKAKPETIGGTDEAFDLSNYIDWIDSEFEKLKKIKNYCLSSGVSDERELLLSAICQFTKRNTQKEICEVEKWIETDFKK